GELSRGRLRSRPASPSRTRSGCPLLRQPVLRPPRPDPGPLRDGPPLASRWAGGTGGRGLLRRQPPVAVPAGPGVPGPRPAGLVPGQTRPQGRQQVHRRGVGLRPRSPGRVPWPQHRRVAPRHPATPASTPPSPHPATAPGSPGKKTTPSAPALTEAGPLPLDLAARYERLRAAVLLRGSADSHEAALIAHSGIPGWVDFTRRFGEGRPPPHPPRTPPAL